MATIPMEPRGLALAELELGLVLRLCPADLERSGAQPGRGPKGRVIGWHFFLCVSHGQQRGLWLPLFSRPLRERPELSRVGRTGASFWTGGSWHYEVRQVWCVEHDAVVRAANTARDPSHRLRRNRLTAHCLPSPWGPQHRVAAASSPLRSPEAGEC